MYKEECENRTTLVSNMSNYTPRLENFITESTVISYAAVMDTVIKPAIYVTAKCLKMETCQKIRVKNIKS